MDELLHKLRKMDEHKLDAVLIRVREEKDRRYAEKRRELIEQFKTAFFALRDAGIRPTYCEEDWEDPIYLLDWDGFDF